MKEIEPKGGEGVLRLAKRKEMRLKRLMIMFLTGMGYGETAEEGMMMMTTRTRVGEVDADPEGTRMGTGDIDLDLDLEGIRTGMGDVDLGE